MFDQRNIEIDLGEIQISPESMFENLAESESAIIHFSGLSDLKVDMYESKARLSLQISTAIFDKIAVEWCRKRGLQGAVGGPVGKEFGGPDCEYS